MDSPWWGGALAPALALTILGKTGCGGVRRKCREPTHFLASTPGARIMSRIRNLGNLYCPDDGNEIRYRYHGNPDQLNTSVMKLRVVI